MNATLLVEIGGTHTRCAVSGADRRPQQVKVFRNAQHDDLASVISTYLEQAGGPAPAYGALAVAAPVDDELVRLTNLGWTVDRKALARRFGWERATVVNDFEALACALPLLETAELVEVKAGEAVPGAPLAVIGPGTGLGVSGLVQCRGKWCPVPAEGGHVTLPASNDREAEIIRELRQRHGHVSAERVISGPGLLALYRLLASRSRAATPEDVARRADAGDDDAASALDLFFGFLGTVAGDLALTLGARGGVYLGGGILPAMRSRLTGSCFSQRFTGKGRFSPYLEAVPVKLITAREPALRGLASCALSGSDHGKPLI